MPFKYTGVLAKRRTYSGIPGPLANDAARTAWFTREEEETMRRWRALFAAHSVEFGDWYTLLRRLAAAHVPGFATAQPQGRPQIWDPMTKAELRVAVDDYIAARRKAGKGPSVPQACGSLCTQEPWKSKLHSKKNPVEALRGQYNTADPRWVVTIRDLREYERIKAQFPAETTTEEMARNLLKDISRSNKSL